MKEGQPRPIELDMSKLRGWDDLDQDADSRTLTIAELDPSAEKRHPSASSRVAELSPKQMREDSKAGVNLPENAERDRLNLAEWRKQLQDSFRNYYRMYPSVSGTDSFADIFGVFLDGGSSYPGAKLRLDDPMISDEESHSYFTRPPHIYPPRRLDITRVVELRTQRDGVLSDKYPTEFAERIFGLRATDPKNSFKYDKEPMWGTRGLIPEGLGDFYLAAELAEAWSKDAAKIMPLEGGGTLHPLLERPIAPILDVPSPILEKVHEKHLLRLAKAKAEIKNIADGLFEVARKFGNDYAGGEQAMLKALVDRFYVQTKYVEGQNSLLDIFTSAPGEAVADCEGRAKAMAVILEQMGYAGNPKTLKFGYDERYEGLKFEMSDEHVRLLVQLPTPTERGYGTRGGDTFVLEGDVEKWEPTPGTCVVSAAELRQHLLFGEPLPINIEPGIVGVQESGELNDHSDSGSGTGFGSGSGMSEYGGGVNFHITGDRINQPRSANRGRIQKTSNIVTLRVPRVLVSTTPDRPSREPRREAETKEPRLQLRSEQAKAGPLLLAIKERMLSVPQDLWGDLKGSMEGMKLRHEYALAALLAIQGVVPEEASCIGIDVADAAIAAIENAVREETDWSVEVVEKLPKAEINRPPTNLFDAKLLEYWDTHFDSIDYIVSRDLANLEARPEHLQITPGPEERSVTAGFWSLVYKQGVESVDFVSPDKQNPLKPAEVLGDLPPSLRDHPHFRVTVDGNAYNQP